MTVIVAFMACLLVWIGYRVCDDIVLRANLSYANASRVWAEATTIARDLIEDDIPASVADLVVVISALAGCGCFVRGLILAHYLPQAAPSKTKSSGTWDGAFAEIEALDADKRRLFTEFLAKIVVYDSYRNPIAGRILRAVIRPQTNPSPKLRWETQLATYSVVSRKNALDRAGLKRSLTPA